MKAKVIARIMNITLFTLLALLLVGGAVLILPTLI